jgi:hypothetical protein
MNVGSLIAGWPVWRQVTERDPLGLGKAAQSRRSKLLRPRIEAVDRTVQSVCPYCAVFVGEVYEQGTAGRLARVSKVSSAAGGALLATGGRRSRAAAAAGGLLVLAGGMALRWSVFRAGFQSARDPRYTIIPQRERKAARQAESHPAPRAG